MMILAWIIIGGIAGWLADALVKDINFGLLGDIVIGIVGAVLGGFLLTLLLPGSYGFSGFNLGSLVVSFVGAVVLLLILRAVGVGTNRTINR
jgi:uncharacterized membrane protein YeaQ/YmgE (transglycosylase-associated protein family)